MNAKDSEELTRVGAGTVMGEFMRQYWIPAIKSGELQRDGAPIRLMLLGEKLIAFRDSSGRVGVMQHQCPHRCASLFLGRNEEDGIRCIYHGWKFDVTGRCVDLPNSPEGDTYKDKVRIKAYPAVDAGDLIWAYMGPAEKQPPFPEFEWTKLPKSHRYVTKFVEQCNYLQAMEGDYDPSHARFLHSTLHPAEVDALRAAGSQQNIFSMPVSHWSARCWCAARISASRDGK